MAKFCGLIGFDTTYEEIVDGLSTGVWKSEIVERPYYGDVLRYSRKYSSSDKVNDDIEISNELSIVADPFVMTNFHNMKYVKWLGACWKITSIDIQYPRVTLQIGGVYNGETVTTA